MDQVEIYKSKDGATQVEVRFEGETFWLSLNQIALLFERDKSVISKHLRNIYKEEELEEKATVAKNATVQFESGRKVKRNIEYYNLDAILSIGYRVNSKQGTRFRQWATQRLKEIFTRSQHAFPEQINPQKQLDQLVRVINIVQQSGSTKELSTSEAKGLLDIITNYTQSFVLLNQFDSNRLVSDQLNENITYEIEYTEAVKAIDLLKKQLIKKKEATGLFGNQKDYSFQGILGNIVQTFGGEYLYKSIEEQAAHLLYFVIKNHPFSDGNKRIGAFLFVWFLEKNKHRVKKDGEVKINDNGLVALALLVAQSNPDDKELMISLIINLINNR